MKGTRMKQAANLAGSTSCCISRAMTAGLAIDDRNISVADLVASAFWEQNQKNPFCQERSIACTQASGSKLGERL